MYDMTNNELLEAAARITPQWLAGFFDGEGCVSVLRQPKHGTYNVNVQISQNDPKILALIAWKFSGRLQSVGKNGNQVRWTGKSCLAVLEYIHDHVICKKRQVEAAIKFARTMNASCTKGLSPEVIAVRDEMSELIKTSNRRNDSGLPDGGAK